ncbi:MAG: hypothetical protein V4507_06090 [Verrucomicrobiota bacterium]
MSAQCLTGGCGSGSVQLWAYAYVASTARTDGETSHQITYCGVYSRPASCETPDSKEYPGDTSGDWFSLAEDKGSLSLFGSTVAKLYGYAVQGTGSGTGASAEFHCFLTALPKGCGGGDLFIDGERKALVELRGTGNNGTSGEDTFLEEDHTVEYRPIEKNGFIGEGRGDLGSIRWYSTFGNGLDYSRIGSLNIYETEITEAIYTPSILKSTASESDSNNEIIKEGENYRQIKTLQSFADIVTISPAKFEIRYYLPSQVGVKAGNLYLVSGIPAQTWVFEKPSSSTTNIPQLLITSHKGELTKTFLFARNIAANTWALETEGSRFIQKEEDVSTSNPNVYQRIFTAFEKLENQTTRVLSKKTETYQKFPWGEELISLATDPDGDNLVIRYYYYEDSSDKANYSKQKAIMNPDGSWEKYIYYLQNGAFFGKKWKTYRPYLNSPSTYDQATDANCKVTEVQYGYYNSFFPEYTNFQKEIINGVVTSQKSWQQYDEDYTAPNGQVYNTHVSNEFDYYGPALTQYTWQKKQTYSATDNSNDPNNPNTGPALDPFWLQGKTACISYPDGRKDVYWYELGTWSSGTFAPDMNGGAWREMVTHGRASGSFEIENETTRSVLIRDSTAYTVQEQTQIYSASGYQTLSQTTYQNDAEGRQIQVIKDGRVIQTNSYTDGLKMSETDETGITTVYSYDDFGKIKTSTKQGVAAGSGYPAQSDIVTTYTYDAAGRQTGQVVTAGSLTQTADSTYDKAGRIESETNQGLTTWHSYWNGGLDHQITSPNGATQIIETYLDGQTKSITGTGIVSQYYAYSIQNSMGRRGLSNRFIMI